MFERLQGVPITKEEIRTIQISKARLRRGGIVHDIGCGSGSISVEAALQVGVDGIVTGVDRNPDAIQLCNHHSEKFGVTVRTIQGEAVDVVPTLSMADVIFVGGTGGQTAEILRLCRPILKPAGRIVVGTIQIETLAAVLDVIYGSDYVDVDIIGVTILKSRRTSTGTMMLARNPVSIVSASAPDK